jgi:putative transposase
MVSFVSETLVRRAYRYRCYPTARQAAQLSRTFGCVRLVYNLALETRSAAWSEDARRVGYAETSVLLTKWKQQTEFAFLSDVSSVPL